MSVIPTSTLEWKFGDGGGDAGVKEMYADTEQLAYVSLMTARRGKRERGSESTQSAAHYSQTAQTVRNYAPELRKAKGNLLPAPRPTLISSTKPHFCLSAITMFTTKRTRALTLTRSSFSEGPGLKL